jgi:hypothetical protein
VAAIRLIEKLARKACFFESQPDLTTVPGAVTRKQSVYLIHLEIYIRHLSSVIAIQDVEDLARLLVDESGAGKSGSA